MISVKNTEPQIGENFSSHKTTIEAGDISIEGRAVTNGLFDYIINEVGELIVGRGHYYMSKGAKEVQAAGTLKIYKGKVFTITNNSGHYKPNASEFENSISRLKEEGIKLSGVNVKSYDSDGKLSDTFRIE